jgi:TrmH family RNA methyltransferase
VGRRSARQAEGRFVVEGAKVLGEALAAGVAVESVYVDRSLIRGEGVEAILDAAHAAGSRIYDVEAGVVARVAGTVTPQPLLAVVPAVDVPLSHLLDQKADLVVVCVDVRDPGNAGTVLRSAEAAGAGGVICCDGSVDVFNPKTVRASAGAVFHVPVVAGGDPDTVLDELGRAGLRRLGTVARGGVAYTDVDMSGPVAIVLGNEAHGLSPGVESHLDGAITIPMVGRAESLNVGMAAAIICFEAVRQRGHGGER